jgi:hypothetical protein
MHLNTGPEDRVASTKNRGGGTLPHAGDGDGDPPSPRGRPSSPSLARKEASEKMAKSEGMLPRAVIARPTPTYSGDDVQPERYDMLLDEELPALLPIAPPLSNKVAYKNYMLLRYEYQRRGMLTEDKPIHPPISPKPSVLLGAGPPPPRPTRPTSTRQIRDFDPSFQRPLEPPPPIPTRQGRGATALRSLRVGKFAEVLQDGAWSLCVVQQVGSGKNANRFKVLSSSSSLPLSLSLSLEFCCPLLEIRLKHLPALRWCCASRTCRSSVTWPPFVHWTNSPLSCR